MEKSQSELDSIDNQLNKINEFIKSKDNLIQEKIAKFNYFFSKITERLYREQFILSSDINKKIAMNLRLGM